MALIRKHHPSSLASLKRVLRRSKVELSEEEFLRLVGQHQSEGHLSLHAPQEASTFTQFLKDYRRVWWVYAILLVVCGNTILVAYNATDQVLSALRFIFGLGLLGFVPGYSTVRALFPNGQLSVLEQIIQSIFLSVLISITLGTILGAELLFNPAANLFLLISYTLASTLTGAYRSFAFHRRNALELPSSTPKG